MGQKPLRELSVQLERTVGSPAAIYPTNYSALPIQSSFGLLLHLQSQYPPRSADLYFRKHLATCMSKSTLLLFHSISPRLHANILHHPLYSTFGTHTKDTSLIQVLKLCSPMHRYLKKKTAAGESSSPLFLFFYFYEKRSKCAAQFYPCFLSKAWEGGVGDQGKSRIWANDAKCICFSRHSLSISLDILEALSSMI